MRRALSALRASDPETAERLLSGIAVDIPGHAEAWHYRAIAAHQRNRPGDAAAWFERAAALAPERTDFVLDHARFLLERGDAAAALAATERIPLDSEQREKAELFAAEALVSLDRVEDAAARLGTYLESRPGARTVRMRLFALLDELARDEAALKLLEDALEQVPDDFEFAPLLATALRGAGRHEEADHLSRSVTATGHPPAASWLDLAVAAAQRGDTAEAVSCASRATRQDPLLGNAWLLLAEVSADPEASPFPLPDPCSASLQFAHARLLDRRKRYDEAWHAYEKANRMAEEEDGEYSPSRQETYTNGLATYLDTKFIEYASRVTGAAGDAGPVPIFICGVSRSGTTLLEQMLAAHSSGQVRAGGELRSIHRILRREFGPHRLLETGGQLASMAEQRLRSIAEEWRRSVRDSAAGSACLSDKMPSNVFLLGLLHAVFPRSPIVLMERDPAALACSCFVTPFAEGHLFSHRLDTITHYFAQFRRIADHWSSVLPPGRILRIRYEDLLTDPERVVTPLLRQLDLSWNDSMLEFHQHRGRVMTASLLQVRRPLDPGAGTRWRRFESHLAAWQPRLESAYWRGDPER